MDRDEGVGVCVYVSERSEMEEQIPPFPPVIPTKEQSYYLIHRVSLFKKVDKHVCLYYINTCKNLMETGMTKKLTLTLESKVIEAAKVYAKKNNMSLSGIIELYFKTLSSEINSSKIPPITKELSGIARFATTKSDKELLEEALTKRFI